MNGHIIGFRLQTQKLESTYKTPSSSLAVKGLRTALWIFGMDAITWKCFYDNIRGNVVFNCISDFNGLYMNKNGRIKRFLVLADSDIIDCFVYNIVKILREIMSRIKADENIS